MADEENAPSFLEDNRVKFIKDKVCAFLRLQRQAWNTTAAKEEFQTSLKRFFDKETVLFFSLSETGSLDVSNQVSP